MLYIALLILSALSISSVAGYFSIVGLMAIFPGSPIPVAVMGASLELGKLITASWIYRNWKTANKLLKTYFTFAVLLLSIITSIGIFGYLSKAHIENGIVGAGKELQITQLETQKQSAERRLKNAQTSLDTLDRLTTGENINDANYIRNRQKRERASLNKQIEQATADIQNIETNLLPLKTENLKLEAEVGPIKYIAEMFYGSGEGAAVDKAVRMMIVLLIFVFDPLAILLVVAANISILSLTKKQESGITDYVEDDEEVNETDDESKEVVRKVKKPRKKQPPVVVESPTDFFSFEKHVSSHDIPAPDPARKSWRDVKNKIVIDKDNVRRM